MKALNVLIVSILTVSVLSGCGLFKKTVQSDATIMGYSKEQLVSDASVIVTGKVVSSEVQNDFEGFPVTDYKIKVEKVYKGTPGKEVEVRTQGGENEEMVYVPDEDMVTFEVGEQVTVFLTDDKGERPDKDDFGYFVVGQYQGKIKEESGKLKNKKFDFNSSDFEKELKDIEARNKANNVKPNQSEDGTKDI